MRRTLVLAIVLVSLFCQGLSATGQGLMAHTGTDLDHAALHWQKIGHHHDADGDYHADDSDEAMSHVVLTGGPLSGGALLYDPVALLLGVAAVPPPSRSDTVPAPPYIDGIRRPPRLAA